MSCSMTWIMLQTCWKTTDAGLEKGFRHTVEVKASLKVCSLHVSLSGNKGDGGGHQKGPKGDSGQRWSICIKAEKTAKVEVVKAGWGESGRAGGWMGGWVGGQGGSGADVSRAEDGRASRKDAIPSMPLLQPGAGRGKEENREKIKLKVSSAHSPAAAQAANRQQSSHAQPFCGFELLRIKIPNNGVDNSHSWSVSHSLSLIS